MSGLDILRSFAESREHDAVMIRDGINYGNVRDVQRLIAELERQLAAERERREAAENLLLSYESQDFRAIAKHFARYEKLCASSSRALAD